MTREIDLHCGYIKFSADEDAAQECDFKFKGRGTILIPEQQAHACVFQSGDLTYFIDPSGDNSLKRPERRSNPSRA